MFDGISCKTWIPRLAKLHTVALKWYGIQECPECGRRHDTPVLVCTECGHHVELVQEEVLRIITEAKI